MSSSAASETVLVINAGSSSLKFALVDARSGARLSSGLAERLGSDHAALRVEGLGSQGTGPLGGGDHRAAVAHILDLVRGLDPSQQPVGVGHRVVHGGERFADSAVITDDVVEAIERFSPLAPLHNPPGLLGIRAVAEAWPDLPQVAVFDTAFHQTMPEHAYRYAVPEAWYAENGVRRYGFHGTSHRYVSGRAAELLGRDPGELALLVAHLGNGCSATAVLGGRSVDTTMGLTPLEGLVMGTRSGDVDPGLFGFLEEARGMSASAVGAALNQQSGLLGLSGVTNDMRALWEAADGGHHGATLAVHVFVYRLAKALSALVVGLGRLDALVFTGGIGENDDRVRAMTVERLGFLGLEVDAHLNAGHPRGSVGRIGTGNGPEVLVVPTDEELMIAQDTVRLVLGHAPGGDV
ncbi:MAG: acetate kinase [Nocardioidaceae bacterium]